MRYWLNRKAVSVFVSALTLAVLVWGTAPVQPALALPWPEPPPGCYYIGLPTNVVSKNVTGAIYKPVLVCPPPAEASITLTVVNAPAGAWTAVQWGLPDGKTWSDVTNWIGPLDQSQYGWMPHWVDRKDYNTGPFRWVVYDKDPSQGGKVLATSDPFNFPAGDGQMVWTQITLPAAK